MDDDKNTKKKEEKKQEKQSNKKSIDETPSRSQMTVWLIIGLIAALILIVSYGNYYSGGNKAGITANVIEERGGLENDLMETEKTDESSLELITFGWIGPLTGDVATLGQNARKAVELAVEEINEEGGINGKTLQVIYEDSRCNAKDAINAGNKLINNDKVSAIIGGLCSSETLAVAPIAEGKKTVLLSYCSSSPDITKSGDYIFRNYPSDSFQGEFLAEYVYNELELKTAGILYCLSDYCIGIKDTFKKRYIELGGTITNEEGVEQSSVDLKTPLTKIKSDNPDALLMVAYTQTSIAGIQEYKELEIQSTLIGAEVWEDPSIWEGVGEAGNNIIFSSLSPANEDFQEKWKDATDEDETTLCAAQAYDATHILAQIITEFGTDSKAIKNALYKVKYEGASGKIEFDKNGDLPKTEYLIKKVIDGKPVVQN